MSVTNHHFNQSVERFNLLSLFILALIICRALSFSQWSANMTNCCTLVDKKKSFENLVIQNKKKLCIINNILDHHPCSPLYTVFSLVFVIHV